MKYNIDEELKREGEHLYRCLFGEEAPSSLIGHYLDVHDCLAELRDIPVEQSRTMHVIVGKRLNAVAIQPWLRRKGRRHVLSAKLLLIAYLAECGGKQAGFSRHTRQGRGALMFTVLRGFFGLLRGQYLKMRHGLL